MRYKLIEVASGNEVKPGMHVLTFRNEVCTVTGFQAPRHAGSTGRVFVKLGGADLAFFPSVCGLKIVESPSDKFDT